MLTKQQQEATRMLMLAQHEWLETYGWQRADSCQRPENMRWSHPKLEYSAPLVAWEAIAETRAKPSLGRTMLSRKQRAATDDLERAQLAWLQAYGWQPVSHGRWTHPTLPSRFQLPTHVALYETRANPRLGWPQEKRL